MKRVIIDVFPTDWSPRNTSLYLANGANEVLDGRALAAGAWFAEEALLAVDGAVESELIVENT
jgi:hypothetical protein